MPPATLRDVGPTQSKFFLQYSSAYIESKFRVSLCTRRIFLRSTTCTVVVVVTLLKDGIYVVCE